MSKMHEYSGLVTVTLRRRWLSLASDKDDFIRHTKRQVTHYDGLNDFNEGDIKDIEVDDVEKVD